jgi:trans-L-3-hydroxyproline dehydratase
MGEGPIAWRMDRLPAGGGRIATLDLHAAGEPLRVVTAGAPEIPGATMLARRRWMREHADDLRRALMWEPRGHADMYGCIVTPPVSAEADVGVLFLHNEGYSTMCGHGVIALVTALIGTGTLPAQGAATPVALDTPAGLVRATAHLDAEGRVERVSFVNVPSFVLARDVAVTVPGVGPVLVDVAFGGAFYAVLPAERVGLRVAPDETARLVAAGEAIKRAVNATLTIRHPDDADLSYLYGTILTGPPEDPAHHSRNCCVFANGEVDRSPTGTGVSARLALLAARGELADGAAIVIESILGAASAFAGRVVGRTAVGAYPAVLPEVSGTAYITGRHEFFLDPRDPLGAGFLVR